MITVKEIVERFIKEHGPSCGLYQSGDDCGCDGSAPCSYGPFRDCCLAWQREDGLYYADPRTMEELQKDENKQCREIKTEELTDWINQGFDNEK